MHNLNKEDIIYGINPINEIISANKRKIIKLFIQDPIPNEVFNILKKIKDNVLITKQNKNSLNKFCESFDHQGIAALVEKRIYRKEMFECEKSPLILILDKIQDPRNLGAILRSAHCTNFSGVIITSNGGCVLTASAIKASAGLSEHINICIYNSTRNAINDATNNGYTVYLTLFDGKKINNIKPDQYSCIVIGNEGDGISKSLCSMGVGISIPQINNNVSYNASVAAAIVMYDYAIKLNKIK